MDNSAADLIALKKICKELQAELAFAAPDAEKMRPALFELFCIKGKCNE